VFGGVAEGRVTMLSDIDVLVILSRTLAGEEISDPRSRILVRAMDIYGIPFDAPVELHVADLERAQRYLRRVRRLIEI
jgi:predicted nucleotidyltransferase